MSKGKALGILIREYGYVKVFGWLFIITACYTAWMVLWTLMSRESEGKKLDKKEMVKTAVGYAFGSIVFAAIGYFMLWR